MNAEIIAKKIETLPEHIKKSIQEFDWAHESMVIAKKYRLQIDELEIFKDITLMIATGLIPAKDYEKNLVSKMHITPDFAQQLVQEANEVIFSALQKRAFGKRDEERDLEKELEQEGITLLDEDVYQKPQTKLQKLTDTLLNNEPKITEQKGNIPIINEVEPEKPKPVQYNEPIELSDLAGVTKHRTPYTHHVTKPTPKNNISKSIYEQRFMPTGSSVDLSPSKTEQSLENGNFLTQIESNIENKVD